MTPLYPDPFNGTKRYIGSIAGVDIYEAAMKNLVRVVHNGNGDVTSWYGLNRHGTPKPHHSEHRSATEIIAFLNIIS